MVEQKKSNNNSTSPILLLEWWWWTAFILDSGHIQLQHQHRNGCALIDDIYVLNRSMDVDEMQTIGYHHKQYPFVNNYTTQTKWKLPFMSHTPNRVYYWTMNEFFQITHRIKWKSTKKTTTRFHRKIPQLKRDEKKNPTHKFKRIPNEYRMWCVVCGIASNTAASWPTTEIEQMSISLVVICENSICGLNERNQFYAALCNISQFFIAMRKA